MDKATLEMLKDKAFGIRCSTIREIASFGSGHIGGSMSIVEILSYLYYREMNVDPENPKKEDRDRLVVSKGHAGPAVYAALASKGFFPSSWLSTLNQGGTKLPSHCDMTKTPGVDFTGGSLGQGFSAAVGIALGQRVKKLDASGTDIFFTDGIKEVGFTHQRFGNLENYGAKNLLIADFSKYSEQTLQNVSTALKKVQQVWKDAFKNA